MLIHKRVPGSVFSSDTVVSVALEVEVCCVVVVRWHTRQKKPHRDFLASVTDLAGSRDSWFRDTSVDPKKM